MGLKTATRAGSVVSKPVSLGYPKKHPIFSSLLAVKQPVLGVPLRNTRILTINDRDQQIHWESHMVLTATWVFLTERGPEQVWCCHSSWKPQPYAPLSVFIHVHIYIRMHRYICLCLYTPRVKQRDTIWLVRGFLTSWFAVSQKPRRQKL